MIRIDHIGMPTRDAKASCIFFATLLVYTRRSQRRASSDSRTGRTKTRRG